MNLYETLGLNPLATEAEVKQAYRRMAMQYHPDRNPGDKAAEDQFKRVQEAYDTLSDLNKKTRYDATLPRQQRPKPKPKQKEEKWEPPLQYADAPPPTKDIWGNPLSPSEQQEWLRNLKTPMPELIRKPERPRAAPGFLDVFRYENESSPDLR